MKIQKKKKKEREIITLMLVQYALNRSQFIFFRLQPLEYIQTHWFPSA